MGEAPADPSCWSTAENLVSTHTILSMSQNNADTPAVPVTGVVPLTKTLQDHHIDGKIGSLLEDAVTKYLTANLTWKIQKMDGCEIPGESIPDLKISVVSCEMQPATCIQELPKPIGEWTVHTDVTVGKPNGVCSPAEV